MSDDEKTIYLPESDVTITVRRLTEEDRARILSEADHDEPTPASRYLQWLKDCLRSLREDE